MSILDWILVAIRWGHALAAVAWVGGGMFYILVLRPSFRRRPPTAEAGQAIEAEFRGLVNTAIGVLLVTGAVLAASRLTSEAVTIPYVAVLAVKVALALYMFYVVRFLPVRGGRAYPEEPGSAGGWLPRLRNLLTSATAVLIVGVVVFGLSDVLGLLFEKALAE
jgi:putative copper export protein